MALQRSSFAQGQYQAWRPSFFSFVGFMINQNIESYMKRLEIKRVGGTGRSQAQEYKETVNSSADQTDTNEKTPG